jgi:glycyl-tRNA synthetase
MEKPDKELFEKIVKIAQNRGFVFNASSIYGGLRSSYDYGPLGTLLKNNIAELW